MATAVGAPRVRIARADVSVDHYIGGRRVASAETFEDRSPLDWSLLAEVSRGDAETADLAVAAAVDAFPAWAALGAAGRAVHLKRLADLIDANVEHIAPVECLDMAMLEESLRLRVIPRGARNYRAYADLAAGYEERVWESNGTRNRVERMPSGPAVVITPWNAPFMLSTWKTAPALAAGCTVVLKPAEWSPLSCSMLADLVDEADMPPGRLQHRAGHRRGDRRRARRRSARAPAVVHRLARDRPPHRRRGGPQHRPVHGRAGRQEPADRVRRRRHRRRRQEGRGPVRRRRPGLPRRHATARRAVDPRAVPGGLQPLRRRARAGRLARSGDHREPAHPPRAPRARRGLRRARAGGGRHDRARRQAPHAGRAVVRADADRAGLERLRGRAARGLRAGADVPDVHGRGRRHPPRQQHGVRPRGADLDRAPRSAPSASAAPCAPARCGSTAS